MSEFVKYSAVTPNLPDATCLIADLIESPLDIGINLSTSSPPSPVFDFPPILFIAIAKLVWASLLIEPKDIAPVANLFTISLAGSTSSIVKDLRLSSSAFLIFIKPRIVSNLLSCSFISLA